MDSCFSVHEVLQERILEWVAFPFSRGSSLTWGSNLGLPHCRQILYHLSHWNFKQIPLWGKKQTKKKQKLWAQKSSLVNSNKSLRQNYIAILRENKQGVKISSCKEIYENNRMGKSRHLFKKIRDTKGTFHEKIAQ